MPVGTFLAGPPLLVLRSAFRALKFWMKTLFDFCSGVQSIRARFAQHNIANICAAANSVRARPTIGERSRSAIPVPLHSDYRAHSMIASAPTLRGNCGGGLAVQKGRCSKS
jgi:hypothetical protein